MKYFLFLLMIVVAGCGTKDDPNVVARVDDDTITREHFIERFTLYPDFRNNSTLRSAYLQQIDHMVDRVYLAQAAERYGLDTMQHVEKRLQYIRDNEMLKQLYREQVLGQIEVSEEEAWEEYKRQNISVELRHLFAPDSQQAAAYYKKLQSGETFQTLARGAFRDTSLANNGGYLGYLRVSDLDPYLVEPVYNLRVGEISRPLRSTRGWHVMRVENVKQNLFLDRNYFKNNSTTFAEDVQNRRAAKESAAFVKEVMKGKSVTIVSAVLQQFTEQVRKYVDRSEGQRFIIEPTISDREIRLIRSEAEALMNQELVQYDDGIWTVGDLMEKLQWMPPLKRPEVLSETAMARQIIDMVRDHYLLKKARELGIDESPRFRQEMTKYRRELLADEYQKSILLASAAEANPTEWQYRKNILAEIRQENPARVDTSALLEGLSPQALQQRVPRIVTVVREQYNW